MSSHVARKPEMITCYIYLCVRACFQKGKRWFAGTKYMFNRELKLPMSSHFEALGTKKVRGFPGDDLAFDIIGREKNRPSEYVNEYVGEVEE